MEDIFQRTRALLGAEAMHKLAESHVAVFGLGGVGSYVSEALIRSGVGSLSIIDSDVVQSGNINRQLIALCDTVGENKVSVEERRARLINPEAQIFPYQMFFSAQTAQDLPFHDFDYVVDAIDTVTSKLELIMTARRHGIPIISSMGTGNRLDPSKLEVTDIYSTSMDPLARVMRRELRKRGVASLKVVCSTEEPCKPMEDIPTEGTKRPPASAAFVPGAAGLLLASQTIRDLISDIS